MLLLLIALILGALLFSCHHPVRTLGGAFSVLRDRTGNGVRVGLQLGWLRVCLARPNGINPARLVPRWGVPHVSNEKLFAYSLVTAIALFAVYVTVLHRVIPSRASLWEETQR